MSDKLVFVLPEEWFQLAVQSQSQEMTENANIYLCFLTIIQQVKG